MENNRINKYIASNDTFAKKISYFFASVFCVGFVPKAPGTFGSLVALPFAWLLWYMGGAKAIVIGTVATFLIGLAATSAALYFGDSEDEDPSFIVIDELAGQLATFTLPAILFMIHVGSPMIYILSFISFRFFDITKPWYVGKIDKNMKGPLGVMLDDIVAALYATVAVCILVGIYYMGMRAGLKAALIM